MPKPPALPNPYSVTGHYPAPGMWDGMGDLPNPPMPQPAPGRPLNDLFAEQNLARRNALLPKPPMR